MPRKKSRASSKQALMAYYGSPSIFSSPRLFTGIASKGFTDTESVLSPTSILDSKPFSALRNPFWSTDSQATKSPKPENRIHWDKLDSRGVGLRIVDALRDDEKSDRKQSKPESRMVLFGSQLKVQIPPPAPPPPHSVLSPVESLNSPADFGIKTRNSHVGSFSPGLILSPGKKSPFGPATSGLENLNSPSVFTGSLSASEMELSEDYTRVISRGPNPRTTHIFDDCIVERCCGVVGISAVGKENEFNCNRSMSYPSESFLSFCYTCKKNLGLGKDIYMYRGEKAFCSSECRSKEMMLEEGKGKIEFNQDAYGACP